MAIKSSYSLEDLRKLIEEGRVTLPDPLLDSPILDALRYTSSTAKTMSDRFEIPRPGPKPYKRERVSTWKTIRTGIRSTILDAQEDEDGVFRVK